MNVCLLMELGEARTYYLALRSLESVKANKHTIITVGQMLGCRYVERETNWEMVI